ncbi:MAG: hypothetical protein P1V97_34835 [Planctomycetota bacterium]|nr:hypothetical protein [Planctomycetota bacterium]
MTEDHRDQADLNAESSQPNSGAKKLVLLILAVLFVAVANWGILTYNPRRTKHSDSTTAIGSLRTIAAAQNIYQERVGKGQFGTLVDLHKASYIDDFLGTGLKQNYRFQVTIGKDSSGKPAFWAGAFPIKEVTDKHRYFFINNESRIYYTDKIFTVPKNSFQPPKDLKLIGAK